MARTAWWLVVQLYPCAQFVGSTGAAPAVACETAAAANVAYAKQALIHLTTLSSSLLCMKLCTPVARLRATCAFDNVCVRITAGMQSAATSENSKGVFHESLSILVEQGTDVVVVELWDIRERRSLASMKFDPKKDLLHSDDLGREKVYHMKQKAKGLLNPRVRLSVHLDTEEGMEKGLLQDVDMSRETDMMLRSQLQKAQANERARGSQQEESGKDGSGKELSKVELFAKGCAGPLDQFGSWGRRESVWIAVRGPPDQKRYTLCIYKDESSCNKGGNPEVEVELLKVLSVQPDPARSEVFIINYLEKNKVKQRMTFSRIDRARDIWVEMLTLLITMIREEKEAKSRSSGSGSKR